MNYYLVLGVPRDADADAVRQAFRALVRRYHPDAGAGSSAGKFREVVEAYETLSDPARRRRYDETLTAFRPRSSPPLRWTQAAAPEPLIPVRRPSQSRRPSPLSPTPLDDMFEEWIRAVENAFVFVYD